MTVRIEGWFATALLLIFITLKLTSVIAWSWWWVLSPLWIPFAFVAVILLGFLVAALFWKAVNGLRKSGDLGERPR